MLTLYTYDGEQSCRPGAATVRSFDFTTGMDSPVTHQAPCPGPIDDPDFQLPRSIVLDAANNRAVIADSGLQAIIAVERTTGDRTVLSDAETGTGPQLVRPWIVALDTDGGRAIVYDRAPEAIVAVDLATGDRAIASDGSRGNGPRLRGLRQMAVHDGVVYASRHFELIAIDLISGDRVLLGP